MVKASLGLGNALKKLFSGKNVKKKIKTRPKLAKKVKIKNKPKIKHILKKTKPIAKKIKKTIKKARPIPKKIVKKKKQAIKKKIITPKIITKEAALVKKFSKAKALYLLKRKDSIDLILKIAGEEGLKVFEFLVNFVKEIDEFTLADKVSLQINFVRSLLYKLYEQKLVSFSRERDKKKGWFIYSWQAHPERLKYILLQAKEDEIANLEKRLTLSQDNFFCSKCNRSYDYVKAMETMFFCENCGSKLEAVSSLDVRDKIEKQIVEIKKEIEEIKKI